MQKTIVFLPEFDIERICLSLIRTVVMDFKKIASLYRRQSSERLSELFTGIFKIFTLHRGLSIGPYHSFPLKYTRLANVETASLGLAGVSVTRNPVVPVRRRTTRTSPGRIHTHVYHDSNTRSKLNDTRSRYAQCSALRLRRPSRRIVWLENQTIVKLEYIFYAPESNQNMMFFYNFIRYCDYPSRSFHDPPIYFRSAVRFLPWLPAKQTRCSTGKGK